VGVHGNSEARSAKSEARKAESGRVLADGLFPSPSAKEWGSAVSSPSGVCGEAPATWRFKTFYRLIKAAPGVGFADIKFISMKFSWGPSHRRHSQSNFVRVRTPGSHGMGAYEIKQTSHWFSSACQQLMTCSSQNDVE